MEIISQSSKEAEVPDMDVNSMPEDMHEQKVKKAAIVVLISQKREAENKSKEELETEIRKALEEGLGRIPWLVLENVIIVEE